jgi:DMSO/TMAO reductase YedYZ heme-binding membrane subunit
MFDILLDAAIASNDTAFNGGPGAELGAHTFLLIGFTMTLILIPLGVMGIWNKWSMRQLGRYWKPIQKFGTYSIWFLLSVHLALLEGFGVEHRDSLGPDRFPFDIFHQRLYEYLGLTGLMLCLRLPPVRRWIRRKQNARKMWQVWVTLTPLLILFAIAYVFLVNELFYKGIAAAQLNPINDRG